MMNILSNIKEIALQSDFYEAGYIDVANLKYYPEIRAICEANSCRNYATSWACPPAVGTIAECRDRVNKYDKMLLFSSKYESGQFCAELKRCIARLFKTIPL